MELEYGVYSIKGKKQRPNEDRYRLLGEHVPLVSGKNMGQLFAVFDGMGGLPRGGEAAQHMCDCLVEFFRNRSSEKKSGPDALKEIICTANMEIRSWGTLSGTDRSVGGCAGTVAWLFDGYLHLFHAGDTVCYLSRDEKIRPLTREHGEGNFVHNYFGMGEALSVDNPVIQVEDTDIILLVSDGVTKTLSSQVINQCILEWINHGCDKTALNLCLLAERRGSFDDITTLVVEVVDM